MTTRRATSRYDVASDAARRDSALRHAVVETRSAAGGAAGTRATSVRAA